MACQGGNLMVQNPNASHIEKLPIFCYYDVQRFNQFGTMDCANWYGIKVESGKDLQALYPAMGRQHINFLGENKLVFNGEPKAIYKSINFLYVVEGTQVFVYDNFFNQRTLPINVELNEAIWFATLPVDTLVYNMLTDGRNIFLITENGSTITAAVVTDPRRPPNPRYITTFGNRFVVSQDKSPNFFLSANDVTRLGDPALCFSYGVSPDYFPQQNRASGVIGQLATLHNQLYILCDFTTDVWANIITQLQVGNAIIEFPFKLSTSYNFDYGISDPNSLSVDFGRMVWLGNNSTGLVSFVMSNGQAPQDISSQAINVLLENSRSNVEPSPFLVNDVNGFLYQYENTIFYRVGAGSFSDFGDLDVIIDANCVEYNFSTQTWARCIEANGERNRIKRHVYFNNQHYVSIIGDPAIYQMAGNIYHNEERNPSQPDPQAEDAFLKYPMRYELVTQQIFLPDYSEFVDDYVEIDFVFGNKTFFKGNYPYNNTTFLIAENSEPDDPTFLVSEDDSFLIKEGTNTPSFIDTHYYALFNPHIELSYSDDGGETFLTADVREFSQLGQYRWRMRWYELSSSRNRCYKLICVSSPPIVILGGVRNTRRISGGAN